MCIRDRVVRAFRPAARFFVFCHHERASARERSAFRTFRQAGPVQIALPDDGNGPITFPRWCSLISRANSGVGQDYATSEQCGLLAIAALMLATVSPAAAANKDMIQLQTQVQALQDQVARMQQSIDMNMGVMKNLIEQSADSVNKMNTAVSDLQQKMQGQAADTNGRMEQVSGQIQSLHDTVDELKSRLAKVSK